MPPPSIHEICSVSDHDRARHACGSSYRDVVRGFRGEVPNPPDLVAHPRDETEVETVLEWAIAAGAAVIPYGRGTSVVGGVEPSVGDGYAGVVTIDLTALDRVLEVDDVSLAARIGAGASGPVLERQLATHIDDFVESVRALTPVGVWESRRLPGSGARVSPDRMLLGSAGALGIINEAWVRVLRRLRFRASVGAWALNPGVLVPR